MPRGRAQKLEFQFNKGWNTEASPMTFPEGTCKDISNCIIDIDGSIRRRAGINWDKVYTEVYGTADEFTSTTGCGYFAWNNVAGSGNLRFAVTQVSTTLYFHIEQGTDTIANFVGSFDFSSFATDLTKAKNGVIQVTSGMGYLFVSGEWITPFYLEYDVSTEAITGTALNLKVRDFEGLDDGLEVNSRPATLSAAHHYNLRNQGWPTSFPTDGGSSNTITRTFEKLGVYPSNADIMAYGKIESADDVADIGKYDPSQLSKNVFGTSPAPRGKFIFDLWNVRRSDKVSGATNVSFTNRPRSVAFHNGRVFYAGINVVDYTDKVYFSQQLTNISKASKCYQENDPTAEEFNELLATDGGVISIPGCGGIVKIIEGANGLVVLAQSGVWLISGQEGKFSATEFFVQKITDIGCVGGETVLYADNLILYWSETGIIALKPDQITSNLSAENITQNTIQNGYLLIGGKQQNWARGVYIAEEKKAVWLYSTATTYDGVNNRFKYNGILVFDLQLGAFYKHLISDLAEDTPYIAGIINSKQFGYTIGSETVTAEGANVTAGGVDVTAGSSVDANTEVELGSWRFLTIVPKINNQLMTSSFRYLGFMDWYFQDGVGVDFSSYIETGYMV